MFELLTTVINIVIRFYFFYWYFNIVWCAFCGSVVPHRMENMGTYMMCQNKSWVPWVFTACGCNWPPCAIEGAKTDSKMLKWHQVGMLQNSSILHMGSSHGWGQNGKCTLEAKSRPSDTCFRHSNQSVGCPLSQGWLEVWGYSRTWPKIIIYN